MNAAVSQGLRRSIRQCSAMGAGVRGTSAGASGMTLVEVLLAVAILGVCLLGLMQGMGACMAVFRSSAFVQQAANAMARAEAQFPLEVETDPEEDLEVAGEEIEDSDGWLFSRVCEADEDEDEIYVVRSKVARPGGRGGASESEFETVRLLYLPGFGKD